VLSDTERKLLRIVWKLYRSDWHKPDLTTLCRLSQRTPEKVKAAVSSLIAQGYIEAQDGRLRVVAAWELNRRLI
jgi:predicted transcriptional regulator